MKYFTITVLTGLNTLLTLTTGSTLPATDPTLDANLISREVSKFRRQGQDGHGPVIDYLLAVPSTANNSPTCCPVSVWDWPYPVNAMDAQSAINAVRAANSANDFEAQNGCALATCTSGAGIWFCAEPANTHDFYLITPLQLADFSQTLLDSCSNGCGQFFTEKGQPYNIVMHAC